MDAAVPHGNREPMSGLRTSPSSANTGQPDFVEDASHTGGLKGPGLTCYDPDCWGDDLMADEAYDPYDWDDYYDGDYDGERCACPLYECNCYLWRSAKGLAMLGQLDRDAEQEDRDEQREWRRKRALQMFQRRNARRERRSSVSAGQPDFVEGAASAGQPDFVEDTSHTGGLEGPGLTCYDSDDWDDIVYSDVYDEWDGEPCQCPMLECRCHLWLSAKGLAVLGQLDRDAEQEDRDEQLERRRQRAAQTSQRRRERRERRSS